MRIARDPLRLLPLPASAPPALAVVHAPPGLTALEAHHFIAGTVVSRAQGCIEITTDAGLFLLRGGVELSSGERVILVPEQRGDGTGVRLYRMAPASADQPPAAAPTAAGAEVNAAGPAAGLILDGDPLLASSNIIGKRVPVRILPADADVTMPSLAGSAASVPARSGEASIRMLALADAADSVTCEMRVPLEAARTFEAIVKARRADGTIVRADGGPILLLPPGLHLSEGTRIVFSFEPAAAAFDAPRPETPFEVLGTLMMLLGSRAALTTRSSVVRLLPRPDKALPALAAAFLNALQAGDASAWLGPDAEARLTRDLPELLERLRAAWSNSRATEADTQEQWQTWTIPLLTIHGLSTLEMCRERTRANGGGKDDEGTVRVICDCTFTRLGRVQVDTVCRKPKRCDLVIRTKGPLEPFVCDALSLVHASAAAALGLAGRLDFRAAADAFVDAGLPQSRTAGPLSLSI